MTPFFRRLLAALLALALLGACMDPPAPLPESVPSEPVSEFSAPPVSEPEPEPFEPESEPEPVVRRVDLDALARDPLVPDSGADFALYRKHRDNYLPYQTAAPEVMEADWLTETARMLVPHYFDIEELFRDGDTAYAVLKDTHPGPDFMGIRATVLKNCSDIREVVFAQANGEVVGLEITEADERMDPPAFTREELAEARAALPYQETERFSANWPPSGESERQGGRLLKGDAAAGEMEAQLDHLSFFGNTPGTDFDSPSDEGALRYVVTAAALHTSGVYTNPSEQEGDERLRALFSLVHDGGGPTIEHVRETARRLFGADTELDMDAYGYGLFYYDRYTGILTNRALDYYYSHPAYVLDYEETAEGYEATVVVLTHHDVGEAGALDLYDQPIPEEELETYCREHMPKQRITFRRGEDGALRVYANKMLDEWPMRYYAFAAATRYQRILPPAFGAVLRYREDTQEELQSYAGRNMETCILDEDGDYFYLVPAFFPATMRVQALDWSSGEPVAGETVFECETPENGYDYRLVLIRVRPERQARHQVVFEYGGLTATYPLALEEGGAMRAPPATIAVIDGDDRAEDTDETQSDKEE